MFKLLRAETWYYLANNNCIIERLKEFSFKTKVSDVTFYFKNEEF